MILSSFKNEYFLLKSLILTIPSLFNKKIEEMNHQNTRNFSSISILWHQNSTKIFWLNLGRGEFQTNKKILKFNKLSCNNNNLKKNMHFNSESCNLNLQFKLPNKFMCYVKYYLHQIRSIFLVCKGREKIKISVKSR